MEADLQHGGLQETDSVHLHQESKMYLPGHLPDCSTHRDLPSSPVVDQLPPHLHQRRVGQVEPQTKRKAASLALRFTK